MAAAILGAGFISAQTSSPTRTQTARFGFIPGDYFNTCPICESKYLGSKHSMRCEVCAQRAEDEYLVGNSYSAQVDTYREALADSLQPLPLGIGCVEHRGKVLHYTPEDGIVFINGEPVEQRRYAAAIDPFDLTDMRPIIFRDGVPLGRIDKDNWPPNIYKDFPLFEPQEIIYPVEFPEKLAYSTNCSFYYGDTGKPERQRWKGRVGKFENALAKRRKANKAAKKAKRKTRK
jgi:hypothetical protein